MSNLIALLFGPGYVPIPHPQSSRYDQLVRENVCTLHDPTQPDIGPSHLPSLLGESSTLVNREGFLGDFGTTKFPRSEFGGKFGARVTGWPKIGGYYTLYCSAAELEFLGLDRFEPSDRAQSQEDEEAHCARMRKLGARWHPDDWEEFKATYEDDTPRLFVGWTVKGGAWALHTTKLASKENGLGSIGNALTMYERCKMIEQFGGVFYADPKDCPYLDLDGVNDGKREREEAAGKARCGTSTETRNASAKQ